MWQLARVHLQGVGPPDARFDPLTLDLRANGAPAHSVVWLANGGGKTTLLRLVFHVLRYSQARKIGKELPGAQTALTGLLLPTDVGHVLLEWQWAGASRRLEAGPELLLTGLACGWRPGREGRSAAEISRAFYAVHVQHELGLEEIRDAMVSDGRRVPLAGFVGWLREAAKDHPAAAVAVTDRIGRWEEHLLELGVDPALFQYQIEMNQGEGGADGLLSRMRTPRDVIDFLLRSVVAPESLEGLDDEVDAFVEKVARRPQLELEQRFVRRLRSALEALDATGRAHGVAVADEAEARRLAGVLRAQLTAAARRRRGRADGLEVARATAVERRTIEDTRRGQALRRASGLEQWIAGREEERAKGAHDAARAKREAAEREQDAWAHVGAVVAERSARSRIVELEELLAQRDAELEPIRARLANLLSALLRRLDRLASRAEEAAERQRILQERMGQRRAAARTAGRTARDAAARAGLEIATVHGHLDEWTRRIAEAHGQGVLDADEAIAGARGRHRAAESDARLAGEAAREAGRIAGAAADDARERRETSVRDLDRATNVLERLAETRTEAQAERDAILSVPLLVEVLERPVTDLDADAAAVRAGLADEQARADRVQAQLRAAGLADERDLAHIDEHGVLTPDPSALAVAEALVAAGIGAAVGAEHVRLALSRDERAGRVRQDAALVDAVVVPDVEVAQRRGLELGLAVRRSVRLTGSADGTAADAAIPGHPGTWDRLAATAWAAEAQARQEERERRSAEEATRSNAARDLEVRLRNHLRRWDRAAQTAHDAEEAAQGQLTEAATAEVARATEDLDAADATMTVAAERRREADLLRQSARQAIAILEALTPLAAEIPRHRVQLERLEREQVAEVRKAEIADEEEAVAARSEELSREAFEAARREALHFSTVREPYLGRRAEAESATGEANDDRATGELADAIRGLDIEVIRRSSEERLHASLRDAQAELGRVQRDQEAVSPNVMERSRALVDGGAAEDAAVRAESSSRAKREVDRTRENEALLAGERQSAGERLRLANSLPDAVVPSPAPEDIEQALGLQRVQRAEQEGAAAALRRVEADLREIEPALNAERQAAERLEDIAGGLDAPEGASLWDSEQDGAVADPEAATRARDAAQRAIREAIARSAQTLQARDVAASTATDVLTDTDYDDVGGQVLRDLRGAGVEQRIARAGELADRLRQRDELIASTLGTLAQDRSVVAMTLAKEVDAAVRLLLRVESASKLPEGLGPWTGQRVLRFRGVTRPKEIAAVAARVEATLDQLVLSDSRPRGVDLVIRCVTDLVDTATLDVRILKPNAGEPGTPQPVSALATFSGGQRATVAILLYATLARLRADELRRRGREAGVGVLILDNPLGKASAGFLVDQQLLVAEANGIQLVYATGVGDFEALDRFPVRVRLRNRGVVGRSLRRVVGQAAADTLLGSGDTDGLEAVHQSVRR